MPRRERDLRRLAQEHGWTLTHGGKHWLLRHPSGAVASATDTPGDRRDLQNRGEAPAQDRGGAGDAA